ncbi:hypothetical protein [Streptomyces sp. NPDC000851]
MAFPQTPIDVEIALQVGGTWTDVTPDVYTSDKIVITRGRADEGARVDPGKCTLTFNNRLGKYSPQNPASPYYGLIGRNTPIRVSVPGPLTYLELDGNPANNASTPDTAALDIVGDLDVRFEAEVNWYQAQAQMLIGKWGLAGQRSWSMRVQDGSLFFLTSPDGTATRFMSWQLPALPRRAALRATLDADNGAGGHTFRMYWAASLAGPWTQFGDAVTGTGTTSVFNSSSPVTIAPDQPDTNPQRHPMAGRVYKAEVRNGIDGTIVAAPDFTVQAAGTTSFADSAGRTWTVNGAAEITNRRVRFIGEVSSWPSRWDVSGKDVRVPIEAAGILRRLGQGEKALQSTLLRRVPSFGPIAYWPMEEGASATRAYSPIDRVLPLTLTRATWASADTLPSSAPLPVLASSGGATSTLRGIIPWITGSLTAWHVQWVYHIDQGPAARRTFMRIVASGGTVADWFIQSGTDGTTLLGRNSDGDTVVTHSIGTGLDLFGQWIRVRFSVTQNGGNIDYLVSWQDFGGDAGFFSSSTAGTVGRPMAVASPTGGFSSDLDGMALGHISIWASADTDAYDGAFDAWAGETAGQRMIRLASEENLPLWEESYPLDQTPVGPQRPNTLLTLLEEAATADGGILYERRDRTALAYRDRISLYNQTPALALDYTTDGHVAPPLEPVDDDQKLRNDVTVQRDGGASARAVLEEGPLSVQTPPDGVGVYDESVTLNLHNDDQPEPIAYWRLHLGTQDGARYPVVNINLAAAPSLVDAATALEIGDRITIDNPPPWLPPDMIDLIVQGYTEVIGHPIDWDMQFNCTPAAAYRVGVVDDGVLGRIDANPGGSRLAVASTDTAPQLAVHTPAAADGQLPTPWITSAGPAPTYPGDFPFDIRFGGETARVTACVPGGWDTFTRTVANGWGTADCGFPWVGTSGATTDRSVNGSAGVITLVANKDTVRFQRLVSSITDTEAVVRMSVDQIATATSIVPAILLRYTGTSDYYRARLHFGTLGSMFVSVTRGVTEIGGSTSIPYTYSPNQWFWVRARLTGHRVQMRVWPDGQAEPRGIWHRDITITTSPIASGDVGLTASAFSGNTNVNPAISYDDFTVVTPQLMTVQRSINGVVKPHAVGTEVRVHQPAVIAL